MRQGKGSESEVLHQLFLALGDLPLVFTGAPQQALFGLKHLQKAVQLACADQLTFL